MLNRITAATVAIVLVVACGPAPATKAVPPGSAASSQAPTSPELAPLITPSTSAEPSSVLLSCGGDERFPAAALAGVGLAEFENDAAAGVLKATIAEGAEPLVLADHGWHRVAAGPGGVLFVAPGPGEPAWVMVAARPGPNGWTADAYGACDAAPVLPRGIGAADLWLDPAAPPPGPDAMTLHGLIVERSCAGGEPPDGRIQRPVVVFDERSVVVTITVRQRPGDQDCPGNPTAPMTIELGQPLGDRTILDGSVFPPRDATKPPA